MKRAEDIPRSDAPNEEATEKQPYFATPAGKILSGSIMLALVVCIIAYSLFSSRSGSVTSAMDDTKLGVTYSGSEPIFIEKDAISDVELADTVVMDEIILADDWDSGFAGRYKNSEYGEFDMYAYSAAGEYIVVRYEGGTLIFNSKNKRQTEKLYKKLVEWLE